jgi:hypothetical protein
VTEGGTEVCDTAPKETWHSALWFRDLNPIKTSNFTDAVSITFQ